MNLQIKFDITVLFLCPCFCLGLNGLICFCLGVTCVTFLCIRLLIHSIHNLLRWSFFTFIFNCSSEMNYFIYFTFTLQSYTLPSLSLCASSCSASKVNPFPSTCRSRLLAKEEYKYTPLTSSDFLWWKAGRIKLCLILMHVHRHNLRKIFLLNISSDNNIFREALILNFQLHMLFCGIPVAFCGIFLTSGRCFMLIDNCISDNLK